jgi:hypothetical protein
MGGRRKIQIGEYLGSATLVSETQERTPVNVELRHMREQIAAQSDHGTEWLDVQEEWSGAAFPSPWDLGTYRIELPDGRSAEVILRSNSGSLKGTGTPPF